ncbi:tetracycline resistance MFS efflux pump [Candidatus Woesearchaeota archaeon CG10_big_fil_rev_8_21_14_0_10_34_8]|nr:MAG: tetracycline resistance MFS efflux pump [Candidatus Woesearchaeota archaeon CG10_big_fil_rev_8_21_14_0_10_34_8]
MKNKPALITLLFIVFIDMVGIGIALPILPLVFFETSILGTAVSDTVRNTILGLLIASYPAAQFIGAPILGALSDKYGRKKILLISLAGSAIGYTLFALGIFINNIYILFASRIIDGFTGGNISVVRSAIADVSDKTNKVKNFGLIGMMFGFGFIIGPFIGGKLTDTDLVSWFSYTTPFWVAAILVTLNIIFLTIFFKETLKAKIHRKITILTGFFDIKKGFQNKALRPIYITVFLVFFGWSFYTMLFQVFLYERFSFTAAEIGMYFAYVGIWIAIAQGIIIRPVSNKVNPAKLIRYALFCVPFIISIYLLPIERMWIYVIVPFMAISFGFIMPNLSTLLSNAVSESEQGEALGIQQSMLSLASILPGLLGGVSLAIHPSLPVLLASITLFATWVYFMMAFKARYSKSVFGSD